MSETEFMARLAAIIAPPRYPLVRYAGVLGPRSSWRKDVVPRPREQPRPGCGAGAAAVASAGGDTASARGAGAEDRRSRGDATMVAPAILTDVGDVIALAPNVLSVRHWDRLMGGALYAASPRVDWASLLRRSFDVDVLQCPKCQGRLRVLAVITERASVVRILAHLGLPTIAPAVARARDPTEDEVDGADHVDAPDQLDLGLA